MQNFQFYKIEEDMYSNFVQYAVPDLIAHKGAVFILSGETLVSAKTCENATPLLSMSNLAICIKKAEFSGFKA